MSHGQPAMHDPGALNTGAPNTGRTLAGAYAILRATERAASDEVWRLSELFDSLSPRAPASLRERVNRELAAANAHWQQASAELRAFVRRHPAVVEVA